MTVTLQQMIECAHRELGMRRAVYPNLIDRKKMSQERADREIAAMEAIVQFLENAQVEQRNGDEAASRQ